MNNKSTLLLSKNEISIDRIFNCIFSTPFKNIQPEANPDFANPTDFKCCWDRDLCNDHLQMNIRDDDDEHNGSRTSNIVCWQIEMNQYTFVSEELETASTVITLTLIYGP